MFSTATSPGTMPLSIAAAASGAGASEAATPIASAMNMRIVLER